MHTYIGYIHTYTHTGRQAGKRTERHTYTQRTCSLKTTYA